ncbi:MAG: hypothetical protein WD875_14190 [Pirellulales bacterium]
MRFRALAMFARASSYVSVCCLVAALLLSGCSADADREDSAPTLATSSPQKPVVALWQGRLTIDAQDVALPGTVAAWEAALGAPSRTEALASSATEPAVNVYIWDDRGIVAVERPDLAQVTKVSLLWEAAKSSSASDGENARLSPTSTFPGSLSIDGVYIGPETTPAKLNAALDGPRFLQLKTFPHSWNMPYAAWTVTAITDVKGQRLLEISIGD